MSLSRGRLATLLSVWLYMVVLNWAYIREISPLFGYYGHTYIGPRPWSVAILANLMASAPVFFLPLTLKRASNMVLWILYAFVLIPTTLFPFYSARVSNQSLLIFCLAVLAGLWLIARITRVRPVRLRGIRIPSNVLWSGVVAISVAVYGYLSLRFNLSLQIGSLVDVYDTRAAYKEGLAAGSGIAAYLVGWQANVLNPLVIAFGLVRRRPGWIAAGTAAQILIFSFTGFKSVFFSAFFLFVLLILIKGERPLIGFRLLTGLTTLILVVVLADAITGSSTMTSIFVRRLLVTPGQLSGYYLDFFSDQPLAHLGHSVLAPFFDYPYSVTPPNLIGQVYFGSVETSANAHIWADGFANFGLVGVVAFSSLLGAFLWLFDSAARHADLRVGVLLLGVPAFSLSNSALITTLMSHGMFLAFLVMLTFTASYFTVERRETSAPSHGRGGVSWSNASRI